MPSIPAFVCALQNCIPQDTDLRGFTIGDKEYHISLFADDVVLYVSNPPQTLSALDKILDCFNKISGLHINKNKSEIYPIQHLDTQLNNSINTLNQNGNFGGARPNRF